MVADVELRAAGDARTPGGADGSGARARETAKPRRSRALSRRACRELCVEGRGTAGELPPLAAAGYLRPFQSTWSTERCQEPQVGRHLPAARRTRRQASPPAAPMHALINNQLGPETAKARDKCLGQRKVGSVRGALLSHWSGWR